MYIVGWLCLIQRRFSYLICSYWGNESRRDEIYQVKKLNILSVSKYVVILSIDKEADDRNSTLISVNCVEYWILFIATILQWDNYISHYFIISRTFFHMFFNKFFNTYIRILERLQFSIFYSWELYSTFPSFLSNIMHDIHKFLSLEKFVLWSQRKFR